jgi:uncharacterized Tic20 family protein
MTGNKEKQTYTWGMLCHLTALSAYVGIPFGHIVGPLVIWLIKKDELSFVDEEGKESLNFQISITIYGIISAILCFILIGFFLLLVLIVVHIILIILATVKASNGEHYRYPLTIRLIK